MTFDGNRGFAPRRGLKTLLATALLTLPLWSGTALAQSDQDRAAARSLATQGSESFKAGKYDETIDLLTRAEALVHAPTHLLLIARAQVASGKLVLGKETYLKITREQLAGDAPPAFKQAQEDAKKELAALEPRIGAVRISLGGDAAGVEVTIDGKPLSSALVGVFTPLDPGKHKISAARKGGKPVDKELTLSDGEKKELTLEMGALATTATPPTEPEKPVEPPKKDEPPPPAKTDDGFTGMQIGGLVAAGVGVAGAAVGVIFVLGRGTAQSDSDALFDECNPRGCTDAEKSEIQGLDDDAASKGTIGVIGLAAGGALVATGVTLFLLGGNKDPKPKTGLQVSPWVSADSAGVYGTF